MKTVIAILCVCMCACATTQSTGTTNKVDNLELRQSKTFQPQYDTPAFANPRMPTSRKDR